MKEMIKEICFANEIEIISGSMSPDHVDLLISVSPGLAISRVVQYIKGKSSRKLQKGFEALHKRY
jgi:putative transposase